MGDKKQKDTGPYIGFGWVLHYDPEQKNVMVYSRLIKGPAGRAGIEKGTVLLEENGVRLDFPTPEAFYTHFNKNEVLLAGTIATYRIRHREQERIVSLTAELVKRIRVYSNDLSIAPELIHHGIAFDTDTGDIVPTGSLSNEAIRRVHDPRK